MKHTIPGVVCLTLAAFFSCSLSATSLLFDRGLPTANVNIADANTRSNMSLGWGDSVVPSGDQYTHAIGDDLTIGAAGQTFRIDTLRMWAVSSATDASVFASRWPTLTLFAGRVSAGLGGLNATYTGATSSNPNLTVTQVTYPNGENYWNYAHTAQANLFQIDFNNLNWIVNGGQTYEFFLGGSYLAGGTLNAVTVTTSNRFSGSTQQGADDFVWFLQLKNGTPDFMGTSNTNQNGPAGTYIDATHNGKFGGMNESFNVNAQAFGSAVPEPASIGLIGSGLAILALRLRRR